jgi:hypothetical protein
VTECSSWPTPNASEERAEKYSLETSYRHYQEKRQVHLSHAVRDARMWPTPRAANPGSRIASTGGKILAQEVEIAEGIRNQLTRKRWPTPRVSMANGPSQAEVEAGNPKRRLETEVACFPTPTANRWDGLQSHGVNVVSGQLNPTWVELLMGFPMGWTDLDG